MTVKTPGRIGKVHIVWGKYIHVLLSVILLLSVFISNTETKAAFLADEITPVGTELPVAQPTLDGPTQPPDELPAELPTAEPTPIPTDTVTAEPTPIPIDTATAEPTPIPTDTATAQPTVEITQPPEISVTELLPLILPVQSLRQRGAANVYYHAGTGKVRFLGAQAGRALAQPYGLSADVAAAEAAQTFLGAYGGMFGLADAGQELTLKSPNESLDRGRSKVRFQQVYNGIPVLAGELVANLDAAKNILSVSGEILPDINIDTQATVDAEVARQTALNLVSKVYGVDQATLQVSEAQLWIYNPVLLTSEKGRTSLVWRMEVTPVELGPIRELVLVDAHRGHIVLNFNQVDTAKSWQTYTAGNGTSLPGTLVCTGATCPSSDTHVLGAHNNASSTYDFYNTNFGRDSINGAGMTLISTVHYDWNYDNAFWNGTQMVYGDYRTYPIADDVVAHEMTHGVTNYESNLFYYYQSGAINESISDVFGEFVDLWNGTGTDTPAVRWYMGEDVQPGGAIRNMKNPPEFSNPDKMTSSYYYTGSGDNGGVHYNSGVGNKAAYLMVDGGSFNGYTITGLGLTKVAHIWYEANRNLLTSGSDYADLQTALYQACLNKVGTAGITLADCNTVRDANLAVQMGTQPPGAAAAPEALVCNSGQVVGTTIYQDDLESGGGNFDFGAIAGISAWTDTSPYGPYAHSGSGYLYADDYYTNSNSYAAMDRDYALPALTTGSHHYLRFDHAFDLESGYDGGILEYSTNSGSTWNSAMTLINSGRTSTGTISAGAAFTGRSAGYNSTRALLDSLAGQNVRFRWRLLTDPNTYYWGWWVDDVKLYTCGVPPSAVALAPSAVAQGTAANTVVGTLTTTGGTSPITYTLVNNATGGTGACTTGTDDLNNDMFKIGGGSNNQILVNTTVTSGIKKICVRATDSATPAAYYTKALTITVNPSPTNIVLAPSAVAQGTVANIVIGTLTTTGGTPPYTYLLVTAAGTGGGTCAAGDADDNTKFQLA
jgi:Zn-dependent metalloprotease